MTDDVRALARKLLEADEENQRLLGENAALKGGDEAAALIADLREAHRIQSLELDVVRKSRDFYKSENEQLKKQMYYINQRREAAGMK